MHPTNNDAKHQPPENIDLTTSPDPTHSAKVNEADFPSNAALVYEKIKRAGNKEMDRDALALLLSAIAAGLSMGASMLAKALLHAYLPDAPFSVLIEGFGYTVGFVLVIMAGQQLFTENTVTAVIPVVSEPTFNSFKRLFRLWGLVLLGNIIGTIIIAFSFLHFPAFYPIEQSAFLSLGEHIMENSALEMFCMGIFSGWLIATMVWILPNAKNSKLWIIILITYLIAIGGFTHIVVGSAEVFYLVFAGHITLWDYFYPFAIPTLLGNIFGGTFIFTLLSHAQVRSDMSNSDD